MTTQDDALQQAIDHATAYMHPEDDEGGGGAIFWAAVFLLFVIGLSVGVLAVYPWRVTHEPWWLAVVVGGWLIVCLCAGAVFRLWQVRK